MGFTLYISENFRNGRTETTLLKLLGRRSLSLPICTVTYIVENKIARLNSGTEPVRKYSGVTYI